MKELTIEEKAKRYDEALSWMGELYPTMEGAMKEDAEHYFPELKESEDERIRKEIRDYLYNDLHNISQLTPRTNEFEKWLAWIEKQGEQKQEWSEEDLISLGYLATFVDENGDSFYGKNKSNVVKWIRSFANRHPTQKQEWT